MFNPDEGHEVQEAVQDPASLEAADEGNVANPNTNGEGGGSLSRQKLFVVAAASLLAVVTITVAVAVPLSIRAKKESSISSSSSSSNVGEADPNSLGLKENSLPNRFPERLPSFSMNAMAGYGSCGDLLQDVRHALESLANEQIESGRDMECYWDPDGPFTYNNNLEEYPCISDYGIGALGVTAGSQSSSTESSFETNNQVEGVDEADLVKSNGEYIFMGYGDEVIVMDLDGNVVDRVSVPLPPGATPTVLEEGNTSGNESEMFKSSSIFPCEPTAPQFRKVASILLHDDTKSGVSLNVITSFDDWKCESSLCGGLTTLFLYTFNGNKLSLTAQQDINGRYNNARAMGANHHVVTNANVDSWKFSSPLYRCDQAYWNMTYQEYEVAALAKAEETVEEFAQNIVSGLSWAAEDAADDACQHVIKITSLTSGGDMLSLEERRSLSLSYSHGVLQNFVQITSLDVTSVQTPSNSQDVGTVKSNAAGVFMAQYSTELYATTDDLVLAGRGWHYDEENWDEYTFLMTFDLTGGNSASPKAIGEVKGYLKNQFSMDMYKDSLRVATTSSQKWKRVENKETGDVLWESVTDSTSQVTILKENGKGALEQVGFVGNLGPSEEIKSVRFIKERGYVVTFRTVDPLYSLDLSNPTSPSKEGELKISGFSEYMHPIAGGEGTQVGDYLLTVGKDAEDDGFVTGTKISVFDVRNIESPRLVADYVIENNDGWSSSDATYDQFAFRYLPQSRKLIIPLYVYSWSDQGNNFDGFVVYDIDIANKAITETGKVTHSQGDNTFSWCWGAATLPSRSMVFEGDLVTFKSHSIQMTRDVNTLTESPWELNLDQDRTDGDECHGYWPWMPFFF